MPTFLIVTTFLTMAYILVLNPLILGSVLLLAGLGYLLVPTE